MENEPGFSLMEALVALLIIGVAAAGIIRATEAHVDSIRDVELRAAAQWVAENRLVELGLVGENRSGAESMVTMLGQRWLVKTTIRASEDADLRLVTVRVSLADGRPPIVTMTGFVDAGTVTQ